MRPERADREGDGVRYEEDRAMTERTGMVICDITISADGYSAGLNQTEERPFGDDGDDGWGDKLHAWMFDTREEPVPRRGPDRRAAAARCAAHARRRHAAVRGRPAAQT